MPRGSPPNRRSARQNLGASPAKFGKRRKLTQQDTWGAPRISRSDLSCRSAAHLEIRCDLTYRWGSSWSSDCRCPEELTRGSGVQVGIDEAPGGQCPASRNCGRMPDVVDDASAREKQANTRFAGDGSLREGIAPARAGDGSRATRTASGPTSKLSYEKTLGPNSPFLGRRHQQS